MIRTFSLLVSCAAGVALLLAVPVAAAALPVQMELSQDERAAGLWYADRLKFDQISEQGLTGEGITIAVIDDAINLDAPELQGADIEVVGQFCKTKETGEAPPAVSDDPARIHGTEVVSMLVGNGRAGDGGLGTRGIVPGAKILFYSVGLPEESFSESGDPVCEAFNPVTGEYESDTPRSLDDPAEWPILNPTALAARQAVDDGADIISTSIVESIFAAGWELTQIHAMRAGVPIVAGSTNPTASGALDYLLPFGMNGVVAVGGVDNDGNVIRGSNIYGTGDEDAKGSSNLAFAAPGSQMLSPAGDGGWGPALASGTSLATPLIAGTIALGLEAHPSATAFQVIQSMIRTTGSDGLSELEWNGPTYGYGIVNPLAMLADDPTQYPDENPLFITRLDDPRCGVNVATFDDCDWAYMAPLAGDVWPANSNADQPGSTQNTGGAMNVVIIVSVVAGALLLIGVAVIVPIAVARSRRKRENLIDSSATNVGK